MRAFHQAFDRWASPGSRQPLPALTRSALDNLRAALAGLG